MFVAHVTFITPFGVAYTCINAVFRDINRYHCFHVCLNLVELCTYAASGLKEKFAEQNLTLTQTITFHEDVILTDSVIDGFLNRVKQTSRGNQTLKHNDAKNVSRNCILTNYSHLFAILFMPFFVMNN